MISISNLNVDYFGSQALTDISLEIPLGVSVGIVGPNGAGKSTFIKSLLDIVPRSSGLIKVNDNSISSIKQSIAYVPQKSEIDLTFPITVFETVLTGTYINLSLFQRIKKKEKSQVYSALKRLNIEDLADRQLNTLSGGQLQRVFIARALAQKSDIFFLDEPFIGIDLVSEEIIINIINELRAEGKTILIVHHDLHEVNKYFDKLIILNKELVAYGDVSDVFNEDNLNKAYSASLTSVFEKEINV